MLGRRWRDNIETGLDEIKQEDVVQYLTEYRKQCLPALNTNKHLVSIKCQEFGD
jgi:hypothetical protein